MMGTVGTSIVLVEDDERLAGLVSRYLDTNGFRVTVANPAADVAEQILRVAPDLVILDLGLPGEDGFSICRRLRPEFRNRILILTAKDNDIDHVLGLELGADDYVIKPVEPRVLMARVNALLRRALPDHGADSKILRFGRLSIDTLARSVKFNGQMIALSGAEYDLLVHLAMHSGEIQSRETLFRQLYRREYDGADRMLDVRISHLRRKFGDEAEAAEKIKTIWGQGYLFVPGAW